MGQMAIDSFIVGEDMAVIYRVEKNRQGTGC